MRREGGDRASLLVTFWMAIQLAPPLFLMGLSTAEHRLSFYAADRRLVLEHHESTAAHHHPPVGRVVIPPTEEGGEHTDHVVRFPEPDPAARSGVRDGPPATATSVSSAAVVISTRAAAIPTAGARRIGPAPPSRSLPLLL